MKLLILSILMFASQQLFAQTINKLESPQAQITLSNLDLLSFDTKDQIFASNISGDIYQFSKEGKQLNLFSPARQARLHQLEAAWTVNIFSFSADLQEYRILDRFMNQLAEKGFFLADINLAKAATLGNNNRVWVWDESDLSLKILDYLRNLVIQSQPLNLILEAEKIEVLEIREFKNRLFMNVANDGIYLFDNQGNFMKKVAITTNQRMCFYKEHLLWVEGNQIKATSISSSQSILTIGELPSSEYKYLQIGQEVLAAVQKELIEVYPIPYWIRNL